MKRMIVVATGALALIAGSAYAGGAGGCIYGHDAKVADGELEQIVIDESDPKLLALLKKQQEESELETIMQSPVLHN